MPGCAKIGAEIRPKIAPHGASVAKASRTMVMKNNKAPTSRSKPRIPKPAKPKRRREPLPEYRPKPAEDDPEAGLRLKAILASPTYRQADQDVEFLERDDLRGMRLLLDFMKPELLLRDAGIRHTVVVFGSSRISEPGAAARNLEALRAALSEDGGDARLAAEVRVAERILDKSRYYDVAREFGRLVGASNPGPREHQIVIMTGGGPGIMEGTNRGAFDVGARSIGVNIALSHEQFPNPYVTPELCFRFHYFALRKLHLLLRAKALVAFPGGYGTFDELFEVLTLIQTRKIKPMPVILVGEEFWRKAVDFDFLVAEGVIAAEDRELFWFCEKADEIWKGILRWHEASGEPLRPVASDDPAHGIPRT